MQTTTPLINLYNCNALGLTFAANGGSTIRIPATSELLHWVPSSPPQVPTWGPVAKPDVIAPGENNFVVTPVDTHAPYRFKADFPVSVNWTSVQIYLYWNASNKVSWIALNNGQAVSGDVPKQKLI